MPEAYSYLSPPVFLPPAMQGRGHANLTMRLHLVNDKPLMIYLQGADKREPKLSLVTPVRQEVGVPSAETCGHSEEKTVGSLWTMPSRHLAV